MTKLQKIPCRCGKGWNLAMMNENGMFLTLCKCGKSPRNRILETLRREYGWNISSALFRRKDENPNSNLICGKFKTREALTKSLHHLAKKLGLSEEDVAERVAVVGEERAYRALQSALSRM